MSVAHRHSLPPVRRCAERTAAERVCYDRHMTTPTVVDISSLITQTPGVYGGRPCLAGTRFPILQVAACYLDGMTAGDFSISRLMRSISASICSRVGGTACPSPAGRMKCPPFSSART